MGAIFYSGSVDRVIPPHSGKPQVLRLIKDLMGQPQLQHAPLTDLAVLLGAALRMMRRRALVFIVSDFISTPGWEGPLGMLAQRHEVLAIRLYDRREMELPDIGPTIFEDAETGEQLYVDTHSQGFRKRFAAAARQREQAMNAVFHRAGVDVLALSTEGDLVEEVIRFASLRKRRKKAPASFARPGVRVPSYQQRLMVAKVG